MYWYGSIFRGLDVLDALQMVTAAHVATGRLVLTEEDP
jgi:hypothetical protein